MSRTSKLKPDEVKYAESLALLGATDADLARAFGVDVKTIRRWIKAKGEFAEAAARGKLRADATVGERLFERAKGYAHEDTHFSSFQGTITETPYVKHYPPDTRAIIFWLKNRRPDLWREKPEAANGKTGKKAGGEVEEVLKRIRKTTDLKTTDGRPE